MIRHVRPRRRTSAARVRVRHLEHADIPRLEELWRDLDDLHARLWPRFFRAARGGRRGAALAAALDAPNQITLVAEASERLLGFVHAQVYDTPDAPTLVRARRLNVEELAVAPAARRKGVGRRLLREAIDWGAKRGAVEVVLVVWHDNTGAERFYRAFGFQPLHRVFALPIDGVARR